MLVGIDANVSSRITKALCALYSKDSFVDVGSGPAESDVLWISEFAETGGDAFIGLDRQILNKPHEVSALANSGLSACFFNFGRADKLRFRAATIIYWWPYLQELWSNIENRGVYRVAVTSRLSNSGLEKMEFWNDNGTPRVRRSPANNER